MKRVLPSEDAENTSIFDLPMNMANDDDQAPTEEAAVAAAVGKTEITEHDTLKYHLLGPSLTKAGQDSVDQQKVSEIIYNASKGSKYFNNEESKDKNLTQKIERILARKKQLEKIDLAGDLRRADEYIAELELSRDLSQIVVHIDCDAFYAAVEELDRPELKHVPMAVGKGVLTTCNYHARKFGCRSGMAGFVAMKLCPQLICLPLNFSKYTSKAQEVREILSDYDPRFESASIDEAYLNITEYCQSHSLDPDDAVAQLRAGVAEKTKITISAGIAANAKIAKIASNRNKPNGQFRVASDRTTILAFMRDLPTRKVNGVGRVFERELDAIGVKTCGDLYSQRAYLSKLFGHKAFQFLMQCYLGLGRTQVAPAEEHERKSVGTESTFKEMSDKHELRAKLRWIAEELEKDLARTQFKGRTLVLKIKLHTYEVLTRQTVVPKAIHAAEDLYNYSLPMLMKLDREIPGMKLRLMGLRCTHLVSAKKTDVDFFGTRRLGSLERSPIKRANTDDEGWEIWPEAEADAEAEFEEAARQERQDEMEELERLSQDQQHPYPLEPATHESPSQHHQSHQTPPPSSNSPSPEHLQPRSIRAQELLEESNRRHKHGREILPNPHPKNPAGHSSTSSPVPIKEAWACPICGLPQVARDREFNDNIYYCLSLQTIKQAAKASIFSGNGGCGGCGGSSGKENRGAKRKGLTVGGNEARKKLFFGKS